MSLLYLSLSLFLPGAHLSEKVGIEIGLCVHFLFPSSIFFLIFGVRCPGRGGTRTESPSDTECVAVDTQRLCKVGEEEEGKHKEEEERRGERSSNCVSSSSSSSCFVPFSSSSSSSSSSSCLCCLLSYALGVTMVDANDMERLRRTTHFKQLCLFIMPFLASKNWQALLMSSLRVTAEGHAYSIRGAVHAEPGWLLAPSLLFLHVLVARTIVSFAGRPRRRRRVRRRRLRRLLRRRPLDPAAEQSRDSPLLSDRLPPPPPLGRKNEKEEATKCCQTVRNKTKLDIFQTLWLQKKICFSSCFIVLVLFCTKASNIQCI